MTDYIKSGVGGEATDQSFTSVGAVRPLWRLKPLPLGQVNASAMEPLLSKGPASSLQSSCLAVISRGFHNYRADSLQALPSHLVQRVMARVSTDRGYGKPSEAHLSSRRPDEATVWAFHALADPESAPASHKLTLPVDITMSQLPRNTTMADEPEHPLNALPPMFACDKFAFLTTLTLSGVNNSINDNTLQSLKWCTHLTGLWMKGCTKVTDDGIRFLATSMDLPTADEPGKGMWRLRAWWLRGCTQISDRSMKNFAKWPGLALLDLRDTSCTEVSISIFNRTSQTVFAGLQPDFQPCTDGLRQLFASHADPDAALANLCLTLLKPDLPQSDTDSRRHLAFHLIAGTEEPREEWLHEPLQRRAAPSSSEQNKQVAYLPGVGAVYGKGAGNITTGEQERREKLKWALRFKAHEEDVARAEAAGKAAPMSWWEREAKEARQAVREAVRDRRDRRRYGAQEYKKTYTAGRVFMDKAAAPRQARARDVAVRLEDDEEAEEVVMGDERLMLVRMVHPQWRELVWHRSVGESESSAHAKVARRARVTTDVAELLSMMPGVAQPPQSQSQPQAAVSSQSSRAASQATSRFDPSYPLDLPSSPPSDPLATPTSSPLTQSQSQSSRWSRPVTQDPRPSPFATSQRATPSGSGKRNPFAAGASARVGGVRELPAAKVAGHAYPPRATPTPPQGKSSPTLRDPLAFVARDVKPLVVDKERGIDPLDFATSKKRAWGSLGGGTESKAKRMFGQRR